MKTYAYSEHSTIYDTTMENDTTARSQSEEAGSDASVVHENDHEEVHVSIE